MSPTDETGKLHDAAPASVPEDPNAAAPGHAPEEDGGRGGRIDFGSAMDLVDQASQESFPASDSPGWTITIDPPNRDRRQAEE